MKVGGLFSGIGGMELGLQRAGFEIAWMVEFDDYCDQVLTKHWPDVPKFRDVRDCGSHNLAAIDLVCGGFPCQPWSVAGKQRGAADDRNLWPEMLRIVQELRPSWVLGENVAGFIRVGLDDCLADLEGEGYETQAFVIPACAVGAPHRRDRVWIVAYTSGERRQQVAGGASGNESTDEGRPSADYHQLTSHGEGNTTGTVAHAASERKATSQQPGCWNGTEQDGKALAHAASHLRGASRDDRSDALDRTSLDVADTEGQHQGRLPVRESEADSRPAVSGWWQFEPGVRRVATRVPSRLDRLRALGNAVVPQVVEVIGRAIIEAQLQLSLPLEPREEEA